MSNRNSETKPSRRQIRFQTGLVAMAHLWKNHVDIYSKSPTKEKIERQSPAKPANLLSTVLLLSVSVIANAPKNVHRQLCEQKCAIKLTPPPEIQKFIKIFVIDISHSSLRDTSFPAVQILKIELPHQTSN